MEYSEKFAQLSRVVVSTNESVREHLRQFCTRDDLLGVSNVDTYSLFAEYCNHHNVQCPSRQSFGNLICSEFELTTKPVRFGPDTVRVYMPR